MQRELLINLHGMAEFKLLLKELRSFKPKITPYNIEKDNIEQMKYDSARLKMYDTLMAVIDPFKENIDKE